MATKKSNGRKNDRPQNKNLKRGNPDTQFTSDKQPSPKAKSKGWERKRAAQELMDKVEEFMLMSDKEFHAVNQKKLTRKEQIAYNYVLYHIDDKDFSKDYFDRHVAKAVMTKNVDITSNGKELAALVVTEADE